MVLHVCFIVYVNNVIVASEGVKINLHFYFLFFLPQIALQLHLRMQAWYEPPSLLCNQMLKDCGWLFSSTIKKSH